MRRHYVGSCAQFTNSPIHEITEFVKG